MIEAVRTLARRLGVRWDSGRTPSDQYVRACAYREIAVGEVRRVEGLPVVLCRDAHDLYALGMTCPHAGALLVKGRLVDGCLECPLHGARFALNDGAVSRGPARRGVAGHAVQVRDGIVYVSRSPRRRPKRAWPPRQAGPARGRHGHR